MNIRCSYCRHTFNLTKDYVAMAVAKATDKGQKYHSLECINCRKQIKVPVSQMKRYVPEPAEEDSES
jgi:hypothetical protein